MARQLYLYPCHWDTTLAFKHNNKCTKNAWISFKVSYHIHLNKFVVLLCIAASLYNITWKSKINLGTRRNAALITAMHQVHVSASKILYCYKTKGFVYKAINIIHMYIHTDLYKYSYKHNIYIYICIIMYIYIGWKKDKIDNMSISVGTTHRTKRIYKAGNTYKMRIHVYNYESNRVYERISALNYTIWIVHVPLNHKCKHPTLLTPLSLKAA